MTDRDKELARIERQMKREEKLRRARERKANRSRQEQNRIDRERRRNGL